VLGSTRTYLLQSIWWSWRAVTSVRILLFICSMTGQICDHTIRLISPWSTLEWYSCHAMLLLESRCEHFGIVCLEKDADIKPRTASHVQLRLSLRGTARDHRKSPSGDEGPDECGWLSIVVKKVRRRKLMLSYSTSCIQIPIHWYSADRSKLHRLRRLHGMGLPSPDFRVSGIRYRSQVLSLEGKHQAAATKPAKKGRTSTLKLSSNDSNGNGDDESLLTATGTGTHKTTNLHISL